MNMATREKACKDRVRRNSDGGKPGQQGSQRGKTKSGVYVWRGCSVVECRRVASVTSGKHDRAAAGAQGLQLLVHLWDLRLRQGQETVGRCVV